MINRSIPRCCTPVASAMALALLATQAGAAQVCVTTGDQLASALISAQSNNQADDLRVTLGTKTRSNAAAGFVRWSYTPATSDLDDDLTVSGGWVGPDCNVQFKGGLSTLDAQLDGPLFDINLPNAAVPAIELSAMRMVRGRSTTFGGVSVLRVQGVNGAIPLVLLDGLIVRDSGAEGDNGSAVRLGLASGSLTLRNSLITNNSTRSGAVLIAAAEGTQAVINLNNNSVITNQDTIATSAGAVGGVSIFGTGTVTLSNNLLFGNTSVNASDLSTVQFGTLLNNHIGILRGTPIGNVGTSTGDPRFTLDVSGYPVPRASSPLVDSGSPIVGGGIGATDARGQSRVQSTRVDRGAVELDVLFRNGLE